MNLIKKVGLGGAVVAVAQSASATGLDVSAVTSAITDATTAVATIGAAVAVLTVGIFVYKWIRRAL